MAIPNHHWYDKCRECNVPSYLDLGDKDGTCISCQGQRKKAIQEQKQNAWKQPSSSFPSTQPAYSQPSGGFSNVAPQAGGGFIVFLIFIFFFAWPYIMAFLGFLFTAAIGIGTVALGIWILVKIVQAFSSEQI